MRIGIVLIAIGLGDIALTIGLGITGSFALIRLPIDVTLIAWGIIRISRQRKKRSSDV